SEISNFSGAYYHHAPEIEAAAPNSPFHIAEKAMIDWLNRESPRMTLEERDKLNRGLWVQDFRRQGTERYATYAWPGFDQMAFALATVDLWIAAGHPDGPNVF